MRELKLNTNKIFKVALICYAIIFLAGIICAVLFKINFDINFSGGYKVAYSYTGEITDDDIKTTVKDAIGKEPSVSRSKSITDDANIFEISFVGKNALSEEDRTTLKKALITRFKDNIVDNTKDDSSATLESTAEDTAESTAETATEAADEASAETTSETTAQTADESVAENTAETAAEDNEKLPDPYSETSVNPTIAGSFFVKSLFAVLLTAVLVVIYVGIRFKKIGGISAALTALCALILDIFVTFAICILFRLQIDSNYIAVVLTILGYSLNDTIVVYDRVRENRRFDPDAEIGDLVNKSINAVKIRNFVTTLTTFCAVMTIVVVSELYGLTSLRTFAIPMAFGLLSGCVSSLFIAGPLWVKWRNFSDKRKAKKAK